MHEKAQALDVVMNLLDDYQDGMLHVILDIEGRLDPAVFKEAVITTLRHFPILNSIYVEKFLSAYWERLPDIDIERILLFAENLTPSQVNEFLCRAIKVNTEPQIIFCFVSYHDGKTKILILINHMVMDGAGVKQYLASLTDAYNAHFLKEMPAQYALKNYRQLDAIIKQVKKNGGYKKLYSLTDEKYKIKETIFQFSNNETLFESNRIVSKTLPQQLTVSLIDFCKKKAFTVNQAIMAAYAESIWAMQSTEEILRLNCVVDLRRHMPLQQAHTICNFVGAMPFDFKISDKNHMIDTALQAKLISHQLKHDGIEYHKLGVLNAAMNFIPYFISKKLIQSKLTFPALSLSNMGVIDDGKIKFHDVSIENITVYGGVKYKPTTMVLSSTFKNRITFACGLRGAQSDFDKISQLLDMIAINLHKLCVDF